MEILRLRIAVSEEHIRAADLVELIGATNSLYELLAKAFYMPELFRSTDNDLPPDAVLRITYMRSGSDSDFDLLGLDKAIRELRKIIELILERKARKTRAEIENEILRQKQLQEEERTKQVHQETLRDQIATAKEFIDMIKNLPIPDSEKQELYKKYIDSTKQLEFNRNTILPRE